MANYGQPIPTEISHDLDGKIVSKKRWTVQEVQAMSAIDYARNLQNPDFVAAIDTMNSNPKPPSNNPS